MNGNGTQRAGVYGVLLLLIAAFLGALALAANAANRPSEPTILHFQSGGKSIKVEFFPAAAAPVRPPVVVLHGAGGSIFDGPDMRRMAQRLAAAGHPAYFVHYFDRTGTPFALDSTMRAHFDEWLPTVREAITWVHTQPGVGKGPVAIYGYSLGAFLALAASSDNHEVGAITEQAGGIWYGQRERLQHLAPVLMIHGRDDHRVPFEKFALPLEELLKERGVSVKTRFYPGQGHRFTEEAEQPVREEVVKFLDARLSR